MCVSFSIKSEKEREGQGEINIYTYMMRQSDLK